MSEIKFPGDLKYTENDEWVRVEGDVAYIGITDFAQNQLSDIVFVEFLVDVDEEKENGEEFASVESVKAASDVFMPVSGKIVELNAALEDEPELLNSDPFEAGWMVKIENADLDEIAALMDAAAYEANTNEREH